MITSLDAVHAVFRRLERRAKAQLAEGAMKEAEFYRSLTAGGISHTQTILFGGGPALTNSSGVPWTAAYVDTRGEPTCDLRSNIAAESPAKVIYARLINITDDPGIKEALGFLMAREIAHQKSFEKALYATSGKLQGVGRYADIYLNASQGEGDMTGSWNAAPMFDKIDDLEEVMPVDDGDGTATVKLTRAEAAAKRTASDPENDVETGADLGAGPGAGKISGGDDMGTAEDIMSADKAA